MSEISLNSFQKSLPSEEFKKFLSSKLGIEIIIGTSLGVINGFNAY